MPCVTLLCGVEAQVGVEEGVELDVTDEPNIHGPGAHCQVFRYPYSIDVSVVVHVLKAATGGLPVSCDPKERATGE